MKIRREYRIIDPSSPQHPYELFLPALCVISAIPLILGDVTPGSINALLPEVWRLIWGYMLAFGGLTALIGAIWRRRVAGLLIEQVGQVSVGCGAIIYATAAIIYSGRTAFLGAVIIAGFGITSLLRWWQIERFFRRARAGRLKA